MRGWTWSIGGGMSSIGMSSCGTGLRGVAVAPVDARMAGCTEPSAGQSLRAPPVVAQLANMLNKANAEQPTRRNEGVLSIWIEISITE